MTPDIERLAKEARLFPHKWLKGGNGIPTSIGVNWCGSSEDLEKFAALVAEECAKECEALRFTEQGPSIAAWRQRNLCAAAIRAMFALSNDKPEAK